MGIWKFSLLENLFVMQLIKRRNLKVKLIFTFVTDLETGSSGLFIDDQNCRKVLIYRSKLKMYSLDIFQFPHVSGTSFTLTAVEWCF